jgi:hypothetical protein
VSLDARGLHAPSRRASTRAGFTGPAGPRARAAPRPAGPLGRVRASRARLHSSDARGLHERSRPASTRAHDGAGRGAVGGLRWRRAWRRGGAGVAPAVAPGGLGRGAGQSPVEVPLSAPRHRCARDTAKRCHNAARRMIRPPAWALGCPAARLPISSRSWPVAWTPAVALCHFCPGRCGLFGGVGKGGLGDGRDRLPGGATLHVWRIRAPLLAAA